MKRSDLLRYLKQNGCVIRRDRGPHSIWHNPASGGTASVPRHKEIKPFTAKAIIEGLDLPPPPQSLS